jgi:ketosteroid isomerase-like protein
MSDEARDVVDRWYRSLGAVDLDAFTRLHSDDVVYNIVGGTEISGRWSGKEVMFAEVIPKVFAALDPNQVAMVKPYRIFAVDGPRVAGLMTGGGKTVGGHDYIQTYCHLFQVVNGEIVEIWEFFDTELAQVRLFGKDIELDSPGGDPFEAGA